mgnify:CR=1 FL=1
MIPSVVSVYRSAEFQEREIFDLFDKEKTGRIVSKDLETIMGSL